VDGPWKRYIDPASVTGRPPHPNPLPRKAGGEGKEIGTVRYPRLVAKDATSADKLKKRTLTNLYNEIPTRLKNAHAKLDAAVFAAYGWDAAIGDDELLAKLLELNLERAK
jgi:hypothetical protein